MTGMIRTWEIEWAERVVATLDATTRHRIGDDPARLIRDALVHRRLPHLGEWWAAQGEPVINDAIAAAGTDLPDEEIVRAAACSVAAVALSGCPLHHHIVRDVLAAALRGSHQTCTSEARPSH